MSEDSGGPRVESWGAAAQGFPGSSPLPVLRDERGGASPSSPLSLSYSPWPVTNRGRVNVRGYLPLGRRPARPNISARTAAKAIPPYTPHIFSLPNLERPGQEGPLLVQ